MRISNVCGCKTGLTLLCPCVYSVEAGYISVRACMRVCVRVYVCVCARTRARAYSNSCCIVKTTCLHFSIVHVTEYKIKYKELNTLKIIYIYVCVYIYIYIYIYTYIYIYIYIKAMSIK